MCPVVVIGPFVLSTFVLIHAVAFAIPMPLTLQRLLRRSRGEYSLRWIGEGMALAFVAGLLGGVVVHTLVEMATGSSGFVLDGGSTILGCFAVGGPAILAYCRWRRVPVGRVFDAAFLPLPLGQAIGRLGCLAAGCCYGKPTTGWLAMNLPGRGGVWQPRYPTQLLAAGADLLIFLLLVAFERARSRMGRDEEWPFAGFVTLLYGLLYFSKRFLIEFLRDDPPVVLAPLTWAHLLAACGVLLAGGLMAWQLLRLRAGPEPGRA